MPAYGTGPRRKSGPRMSVIVGLFPKTSTRYTFRFPVSLIACGLVTAFWIRANETGSASGSTVTGVSGGAAAAAGGAGAAAVSGGAAALPLGAGGTPWVWATPMDSATTAARSEQDIECVSHPFDDRGRRLARLRSCS